MNSSDQQTGERGRREEAGKHESFPRAARALWPEEPSSTIVYSPSVSVGQLGAHWVAHWVTLAYLQGHHRLFSAMMFASEQRKQAQRQSSAPGAVTTRSAPTSFPSSPAHKAYTEAASIQDRFGNKQERERTVRAGELWELSESQGIRPERQVRIIVYDPLHLHSGGRALSSLPAGRFSVSWPHCPSPFWPHA